MKWKYIHVFGMSYENFTKLIGLADFAISLGSGEGTKILKSNSIQYIYVGTSISNL